MFSKRRRLTYANVTSTLALFVALSAGTAYAVDEWTGANIQDETLTGRDVRGDNGSADTPAVNGSLTSVDISGQPANSQNGTPFVDGTLTTWDVANESLTRGDLATGSVATTELANAAVTNPKLGPNAVTGDKVAQNTLTSADIDESSLVGVNASTLTGLAASELIRVEGRTTDQNVTLQDCNPGVDYMGAAITAPRAGYVLVSASVTFAEDLQYSGGFVAARIERVYPFAASVWQEEYLDPYRAHIGMDRVFTVSQGVNEFALKVCDDLDSGSGSGPYAASGEMTFVYTPFDL